MFSLNFIILLIISFVGYYIIPTKYRYIWLLLVSYYFYSSQSVLYTGLLIVITLITYFSAIFISKNKKKIVLVCGIGIPIIVLLCFKFANMISENLYLKAVNSGNSDDFVKLVMPIGISFYTLVAVGYVIDVYKGKVNAERNLLKYALFISFFPTILSGPIERSTNLLQQINSKVIFSYEKIRRGCLYILWGFCLKLLLANRLSVMVNTAFDAYELQTGATMLFALFLYGIELYVDFASYSTIVIGIGYLFGFSIIENFRQPYFSKSIKEFWSRWHISLSSWLKDYIYIPLGGNRKGSVRKYINLLITFLISGLWHGNGWRYMIWGALHGLYQVFADICRPLKDKGLRFTKIKTDCFSFKLIEVIFTYILVDFAWLFFRAPSAREAILILKNIFTNFSLGETLSDRLYLLGYDIDMFNIVLIFGAILLIVDIIKEKGINVCEWLFGQNKAFRWFIYSILCVALLVGIVYDFGIEASAFIYTRF